MISCLVLERPGVWRTVGITTLFLIAALARRSARVERFRVAGVGRQFLPGTLFGTRSRIVSSSRLCVAAVSLGIGLPLGVLTALYEFPGRSVFFALVTLPLLVPSFLWAIGWASVAARLDPSVSEALSGFPGCLLVLSTQGIPLVLLIAYAATLALSGSQVDAARLAGGERAVFRLRLSLRRHSSVAGRRAWWRVDPFRSRPRPDFWIRDGGVRDPHQLFCAL